MKCSSELSITPVSEPEPSTVVMEDTKFRADAHNNVQQRTAIPASMSEIAGGCRRFSMSHEEAAVRPFFQLTVIESNETNNSRTVSFTVH